jgi:hypothetical protein
MKGKDLTPKDIAPKRIALVIMQIIFAVKVLF